MMTSSESASQAHGVTGRTRGRKSPGNGFAHPCSSNIYSSHSFQFFLCFHLIFGRVQIFFLNVFNTVTTPLRLTFTTSSQRGSPLFLDSDSTLEFISDFRLWNIPKSIPFAVLLLPLLDTSQNSSRVLTVNTSYSAYA